MAERLHDWSHSNVRVDRLSCDSEESVEPDVAQITDTSRSTIPTNCPNVVHSCLRRTIPSVISTKLSYLVNSSTCRINSSDSRVSSLNVPTIPTSCDTLKVNKPIRRCLYSHPNRSHPARCLQSSAKCSHPRCSSSRCLHTPRSSPGCSNIPRWPPLLHSSTHSIVLVLLLFMVTGCVGDLCLENSSNLKSHLHNSATPKGGIYAGNYTKDPTSESLEDCLLKCCGIPSCNVVFFHASTCFLIHCNTSLPDGCDPKPRTEKKFASTVMINVRTMQETSQNSHSSETPDIPLEDNAYDDLNNMEVRSDCSPERRNACGSHGDCRLVLSQTTIGYMCQCQDGYHVDPTSKICIPGMLTTTLDSALSRHHKDRSCVYGILSQCDRHEECVPKNSRSRSGRCECLKNYERDPDSGKCERIMTTAVESAEQTTSAPPRSTMQKDELHTTAVDSSKLGNTPPANSTTSLATSTTTTPKNVASTPAEEFKSLTVSAGEDKVIQLPKNEITLTAFTIPKDTGTEYKYEWILVSHPTAEDVGQMQDSNTDTLRLSKLVAGLYSFKVSVSADKKYGEAFVNVTVLPPARVNQPPVAVVKPPNQEVHLPNDVVIDGSESHDDDKIVKFHWDKASGPLNSKNLDDITTDRAMLIIKNLVAGKYTFRLTVTDSDGVENSTTANVTVIKETDYPPKANAGSNVIISLPQNSVTLMGNSSTDDKGIASYEWMKNSDDKLTADMTGVRTAFLELKNLQVGDYLFTLKVTDTSGQTSTADVHVFVRPESNKAPVSDAGEDKVIFLPTTTTTLDGSNSTDDQGIVTYTWTQAKGPSTVVIENADRAVATASKLQLGEYKFKLTVYDAESLSADSYVTITVKENENHPPKAKAGGDKMFVLPLDMISLDGSKSTDDRKVVSYKWTRNDKSLAAGRIVNGSDNSAVLQITDLIAGRYIFTLTVKDDDGLSGTDTASIVIKPDPNLLNLVELVLATKMSGFTELQKRNLVSQLGLLLHHSQGNVPPEIVIQDLRESGGHIKVIFYARMKSGNTEIMSGMKVVTLLKKKLKSEMEIMDLKIISLDTVICQNECSGHGHCSSVSKSCVCEAFWMHNIIRIYLMDGESNCDWSILYVIIIAFITVVSLAGAVWGLICLCKRWYRWRPKKRHRYSLLSELDHDKEDHTEMLPRSKMQSSSLMVSESDFSSDEETLFVNHRKTNGIVKNGLVKPKAKVKT